MATLWLNDIGVKKNLNKALKWFQAQQQEMHDTERGRKKKPGTAAARDSAASAARSGASGTLLTRGNDDTRAHLSGNTLLGRG